MHIRTFALLLALMPAAATAEGAQDMVVLAAVVAQPVPRPSAASAPPGPPVVPGGAMRLAGGHNLPPGLWLDF